MRKFYILTLGFVVLSGCSLRGFQPPPATWEYFYKNKKGDMDYQTIAQDMKICGFNNSSNNGNFFRENPQAFVNAHLCMQKKGYKDYSMPAGICNDDYFGKYCL